MFDSVDFQYTGLEGAWLAIVNKQSYNAWLGVGLLCFNDGREHPYSHCSTLLNPGVTQNTPRKS